MGLVARRKFLGEDGKRYVPGESCDEALRWRYPALRACLNMGLIEDTDGAVKKHFERRPRATAPELRVVDAAEPSVETAPASDPVVAQRVIVGEPPAPLESVTTATDGAPLTLERELACPTCAKVFANAHGLSIHVARAHRE